MPFLQSMKFSATRMPLAPHEISGPKDAKDVCRKTFEDQNPSYAITIRQSAQFQNGWFEATKLPYDEDREAVVLFI